MCYESKCICPHCRGTTAEQVASCSEVLLGEKKIAMGGCSKGWETVCQMEPGACTSPVTTWRLPPSKSVSLKQQKRQSQRRNMAEYIAIQREAEARMAREARRDREREGNDNDNDNGNGGNGDNGGNGALAATATAAATETPKLPTAPAEHLPMMVRTILCALLTLGSDGEDGYGAGIHVQITKMQNNNTAGRYRGHEGERRLREVAMDMAGANVRPERRLRFEAGSAEERETMMMLLMELVSGGIGAFD
ncbi:hypothetical protein B0H65DRAFT_547269 [Neurospora tetraspora]|uniref:Uncharacterized protein n=1 Tax=Neurospora tetraspora TaxID=94610 RepID=A0AAE0JHR1_9PEZI|nr:hypothetical protein B0H65DRAFT_547269 [Neurospora tetraspora]